MNNDPATMHIDYRRFAFFAKVMCRIKTCNDNRNF